MRNGTIKKEIIDKISERNLNVISITQVVYDENKDLCFDTADLMIKIAISNRIVAEIIVTYHAQLVSIDFETLDDKTALVAVSSNQLDKIGGLLDDIKKIYERAVGQAMLENMTKVYK